MKLSFIMLAGLPATGKSSFRKAFDNDPNWVILSSDDLVEAEAKIKNVTYDEVMKTVSFKSMQEKLEQDLAEAVARGKNIIWDQTNLSPKVRKKRLILIPNHYFKKVIFFSKPEDKIWEARLNGRPGKNIPKHVIETMISQVVEPSESEGFDQVVIVP